RRRLPRAPAGDRGGARRAVRDRPHHPAGRPPRRRASRLGAEPETAPRARRPPASLTPHRAGGPVPLPRPTAPMATSAGLHACTALRGTSSCGKPGILLLLAATVLMVFLGSLLLRLRASTRPAARA